MREGEEEKKGDSPKGGSKRETGSWQKQSEGKRRKY